MYHELKDLTRTEIDILRKDNEYSNKVFGSYVYFTTEPKQIQLNVSKQISENNTITFINCHFEHGVLFHLEVKNVIGGKVRIIFKNCIFNEFTDPRNLKNFIVNNDETLTLSVEFYQCMLPDFEFIESKFEYFFAGNCISYASNKSRLYFNNNEIQNIELQNFFGMFFINDQGKSNIRIRYSDDNLNIENSVYKNAVVSLLKHLNLSKPQEIETKYFLNSCKTIFIEGIEPDELQSMHIELNISDKDKFLENIKITGTWLKALALNDINNGIIRIEKSKVNKVFIHDYTNPDTVFYDIQSMGKESLFEIRDSNFSECTFDKVKFGGFDRVSFYRTSLEKTKFLAVTFPSEIEPLSNIHYPNEKSTDYQLEKYETYRQLSNALSSQGNQVLALEMYKKMNESLRKSKTLSWQDRNILRLNYISNEHGTSISRSFYLFLGFGILFLILFINTTPKPMFNWGWVDWSSFFDAWNLKILFVLADPTHKISTLEELAGGKLSTFNYFISFLSRIVMAWIYYQFVSAFRKFGKKISS